MKRKWKLKLDRLNDAKSAKEGRSSLLGTLPLLKMRIPKVRLLLLSGRASEQGDSHPVRQLAKRTMGWMSIHRMKRRRGRQ
jgi:hypothetical protein